MSSRDNRVDQASAKAGGDIVGRDKVTTILLRKTQLDQLMERLEKELESNKQVRETLEALKYYYERQSEDDIEGLERKLDHAGRAHQKGQALRRKEAFAKLLTKYSLYASAQEIFAILLSKIDVTFQTKIEPKLGSKSIEEIDCLIKEEILDPIVDDAPGGVFSINHNNALGMVYWLAEQCFVRWHRIEPAK